MENTLSARVIAKQHIIRKYLSFTPQGTCKLLGLHVAVTLSHCTSNLSSTTCQLLSSGQVTYSVNSNFVLCKLKENNIICVHRTIINSSEYKIEAEQEVAQWYPTLL